MPYSRQRAGCGLRGLSVSGADAPYKAGRSAAWIKIKCLLREEFVIIGWLPPGGMRKGIGALALGFYDADRLQAGARAGARLARVPRPLAHALCRVRWHGLPGSGAVGPAYPSARYGIHAARIANLLRVSARFCRRHTTSATRLRDFAWFASIYQLPGARRKHLVHPHTGTSDQVLEAFILYPRSRPRSHVALR